MQLKIYRGSHQIGGCVVGIATAKTRILIDMGTALPDTKGNLPGDSLTIDEPYDAVLFTHYHQDHIGLMEFIADHIPIYIGKTAKDILALSKSGQETPLTERLQALKTYEDGKSFAIGDITITPILTDHSAFDAYMLLMEGEGKKVLHTGDFRTHGIKGPQVLPRLASFRNQIDVLLTEGTNLSYENPITTEELKLAEAAETLMERYPYTFVLCSPADFDRLAAFHKAAEVKESFYCDLHQMKLLEIVKKEGTMLSPLYTFERAKVYLPEAGEPVQSFCMMIRRGKAFQEMVKPYIEKHGEKSLLIYGVPEGYLKKHKASLDKMFGGFQYQVKLHTSGHASAEAIWAVAQTLSPKRIIPIHTENPEKIRLGSLQSRIVFLEDGDSYDIL